MGILYGEPVAVAQGTDGCLGERYSGAGGEIAFRFIARGRGEVAQRNTVESRLGRKRARSFEPLALVMQVA